MRHRKQQAKTTSGGNDLPKAGRAVLYLLVLILFNILAGCGNNENNKGAAEVSLTEKNGGEENNGKESPSEDVNRELNANKHLSEKTGETEESYRLSPHADPLARALSATDTIFSFSSHVLSALVGLANSNGFSVTATECQADRLYRVVATDNGNQVLDAGDTAQVSFTKCRNTPPAIVGSVALEFTQVHRGEFRNAIMEGLIHFNSQLSSQRPHPEYGLHRAHIEGSVGFSFVTRGENEGLELYSTSSKAPLTVVLPLKDRDWVLEQLSMLNIQRRLYSYQEQRLTDIELAFDYHQQASQQHLFCLSDNLSTSERDAWPMQGEISCENATHQVSMSGAHEQKSAPLIIEQYPLDTPLDAPLPTRGDTDTTDTNTAANYTVADIFGTETPALLTAQIENIGEYTRAKHFGDTTLQQQQVTFNLERAVYSAANNRFYLTQKNTFYELEPEQFAVSRVLKLDKPLAHFAIAEDGSTAWLAGKNTKKILKIDLTSWREDREFTAKQVPTQLVAMPGYGDLIVGFNAATQSLFAYRQGKALKQHIVFPPDFKPRAFIAVNSDSLMVHSASATEALKHQRITLKPNTGLSLASEDNSSAAIGGGKFISQGQASLVTSAGNIYHSQTGQLVKKLSKNTYQMHLTLSLADKENGVIYAINEGPAQNRILAFNEHSGQIIASYAFAAQAWAAADKLRFGWVTKQAIIYGVVNKASKQPGNKNKGSQENSPSTTLYRFDKQALTANLPSEPCTPLNANPFAIGFSSQILDCQFVDAVYDSSRHLIYAALGAWSGEQSLGITMIDPTTLSVVKHIPLGYVANSINLNLDQRVLSIAARDIPWISEINLQQAQRAVHRFLGDAQNNKPASLVLSLPGKAAGNFVIQSENALRLYREGQAQLPGLALAENSELFSDSEFTDTFWAFTPNRLTQVKIQESSLETLQSYDNLTPGAKIARHGKVLYDSAGTLFNLSSFWVYQTCEIMGHYPEYDLVASGLKPDMALFAMNNAKVLDIFQCDTAAEAVAPHQHFPLYTAARTDTKLWQLNDGSLLYFDGALSRFAAY